MVGDHGLVRKGCRFYEGLVRVPLIFWYPSMVKQDLQSDALVELVDLFPTILDITGLPIPDGLHGKSLMPILTGEKDPDHHKDFVRSEFYDTIEARGNHNYSFGTMIRSERYKLVVYHGHPAGGELFDLENDPNEFYNLWDNSDYQGIRFELMKKMLDQTVFSIDTGPERVGRY
jgi:arylsulfatase